MATTAWPGPRRSIEGLAAAQGRELVVRGCLDLLAGRTAPTELLIGLGGPPVRRALSEGAVEPDYWLRVWALRGLLWLWDNTATESVLASLADESWRVREMAAKVVARQQVDRALPMIVRLRQDPVPRVRQAAERAVIRLTNQRGRLSPA